MTTTNQGSAVNAPQTGIPAETYERYFVPAMFLPWAAILLRHAALQARERMLDVACGTGIVARQAAPLVGGQGLVVGLDVIPAVLGVAHAIAHQPAQRIRLAGSDAIDAGSLANTANHVAHDFSRIAV